MREMKELSFSVQLLCFLHVVVVLQPTYGKSLHRVTNNFIQRPLD